MPQDTVSGTVDYISPASPVSRRFVSAAGAICTSQWETYPVTIRNARQRPVSLDTCGFDLVRHETSLKDADNRDEIERVCGAEAERIVAGVTGADKVVSFDMITRKPEEQRSAAARWVHTAVNNVHLDYSSAFAERLARQRLAEHGVADFAFSRFVAINVWRVITPPPQDRPLVLCDANSVSADEGVVQPLFQVEELPDAEAAVSDRFATNPRGRESCEFRYSANHRWFYFPDMALDEVILFKNYDSRRTGAWRTPHSSFVAPDRERNVPRASIEVRTIAYFR
jgi:hypothetical protein